MNVGFRVGNLLNFFTTRKSSAEYLNDPRRICNDTQLSDVLFASIGEMSPSAYKNDERPQAMIHSAVVSERVTSAFQVR